VARQAEEDFPAKGLAAVQAANQQDARPPRFCAL
jgi:hypothetical protein